jgi:hypothetical protein
MYVMEEVFWLLPNGAPLIIVCVNKVIAVHGPIVGKQYIIVNMNTELKVMPEERS